MMSGEEEMVQLKGSVILSGTAKEGKAGPGLGLVDIGVSKCAYLFRVALPGVRHKKSNFNCDIRIDGKVQIKGEVTAPAVLKTQPTPNNVLFEMKVEQLSPVGTFTVSFNLPGPVDPRLASHNFRTDGILEVVVMKFRVPGIPTDSTFFHNFT